MTRHARGGSRFGVALGLCALGALSTLCGCGADETAPFRSELRALHITEIHYHPLDEGIVSGDEYEFVELKNAGSAPLDVADVGFTQGIELPLPRATLGPGEFMLVASNGDRFAERYGFRPAATYTGRLDNAGERITLSDLRTGTALSSIEYLDHSPWPEGTDGDGRSLVPLAADLDDDPTRPVHWRASFARHGSPGRDDPPVAYINEILAHTDPPEKDSIELYNPNRTPLDVSGWFLSDDRAVLAKYVMPPGTVLPALGYAVFDADDFNADPTLPTSFSLSEHGEQVVLAVDATGCTIQYCDGFDFGDQENGVGFGRYVTSTGEVQLTRLQAPTLGSENAPPAVGPLVISEIMYNPPAGGDEYLELHNTSADELPMFEPSLETHTWQIDGAGFAFPPATTLHPGESVLVIQSGVDEAAFRAHYALAPDVRVFTKSVALSDYGAAITLMKAWKPYSLGSQTVLPFILEESVAFTNTQPWPPQANGTGSALHRRDEGAYANDPANWQAGPPTPGVNP